MYKTLVYTALLTYATWSISTGIWFVNPLLDMYTSYRIPPDLLAQKETHIILSIFLAIFFPNMKRINLEIRIIGQYR